MELLEDAMLVADLVEVYSYYDRGGNTRAITFGSSPYHLLDHF